MRRGPGARSHEPGGMSDRNGGQLAARQLASAGIDTIFCVVAGPMIEVLSGALEEGLRVVNCRHEVSAGFMASAWGYVRRKPGVLVVGSGPGMTNAVTPLHVATESAMPLVVLGGSVYGMMRGLGGFQEADQVAFARPGCKWTAGRLEPNADPRVRPPGPRQGRGQRTAGGPCTWTSRATRSSPSRPRRPGSHARDPARHRAAPPGSRRDRAASPTGSRTAERPLAPGRQGGGLGRCGRRAARGWRIGDLPYVTSPMSARHDPRRPSALHELRRAPRRCAGPTSS